MSTIVFPGAGGDASPAIWTALGPRFETIGYPGWQRYIAHDFSAEVLIADFAEQIVSRVPQGPIHIVGISIGGHFGYAVALRLQASGREFAGFCAIDTFMIASAAPSPGWALRAMTWGLDLLRKRRIGEFTRFLRTRFWRALLRLAGSRLPNLLLKFTSSGRLPPVFALDPIFEKELRMRLLIRATAPWIASLDREAVPLRAPAILMRTQLTAGDDAAWRCRCPNIEIFEIPGQHHTLFEPENIGPLRAVFFTATHNWKHYAVNSDPIDK